MTNEAARPPGDTPADVEIRESVPYDLAALGKLYPAAFPDEDLLPLVCALLKEERGVLSLVATLNRTLVGHVIFTRCALDNETARIALLGPLGVAPAHQGERVGSALVREGFRRLKAAGIHQVQVLGGPAYYGRFGFTADEAVAPPYELPAEWRTAWQSVRLTDAPLALRGALSVPRPWRDPALWLP